MRRRVGIVVFIAEGLLEGGARPLEPVLAVELLREHRSVAAEAAQFEVVLHAALAAWWWGGGH